MATPSFIFGGNTGETPESLKRKRELVNALLSQQIGTPKTIGEGLSALGKGLSGYLAGTAVARKTDEAEKAGRASAAAAFNPLVAALSGTAAPSAPSVGSGAQPGATPTAALSGANTPVYSDFIDTVKQGGVTNPYALAAVAATGKAESAFSPGNANRTWDDGSNNAGGILSWNGPRLQNLMAFAKSKGEGGLGSPQTQAQFFLQENPQLIASLNGAGSLQEAQSMMNNAWRFKGYDQPGGEVARRLSYAQAYLPKFQVGSPAQAAIQTASPLPMPGAAGQMASPDPLVSNPTQHQTASLSPQGAQQPAPPLAPPVNVATPPAPAAQPMAQPGPDMQALSQQFGGSQQIANADPRKGILSALLSGQQNGKAGFPAAPGQGNDRMRAIASVLSNPFSNEGQKAVAAALLKDELAKRDPNNALDAEYKRAQIEHLRNPPQDLPASVEEYNFYRQQAQASGQEPLSYNDWNLQSKKAGATTINNNMAGGNFNKQLDKNVADSVMEQRSHAQDAANVVKIINEGRHLLDSGAVTGAGANYKVGAIKLAESLGIPVPQDAANNTQAFQAVMGQAVGAIIKNFGAGTGLSDADRKYAERIAGGDVTLNEEAIRRIFDISEKAARARIDAWQKKVPDILKGDMGSMLAVPMPDVYAPPANGGTTSNGLQWSIEP